MSELLDPARRPVPPAQSGAPPSRVTQPRLLVGLVLIAAGVVWALFRGLSFYGAAPLHLGYDFDQPPLLLALVGIWLAYRSRRR